MNMLPETVEIVTRMLPLELSEDGDCHVTIRQGYMSDGKFVLIKADSVIIEKEPMDKILDSLPEQGLSRRDDLSKSIFHYIHENGLL